MTDETKTTNITIDNKTVPDPVITDDKDVTTKGKIINKVSKDSAKLTQNITTTVSNLPQMAPDWTNRRKAIFISIWSSIGSIGLITFVTCAGLLWSIFKANHGNADISLVGLAQTIVWSILLFLGAVIGAYCFAAGWEFGNYRDGIINMASKIATAGGKDKDKDKTDDDKTDEDKDKK